MKGGGAMTRNYFLRRLIETLCLAEKAETVAERSIYLRTSRYYRDLIEATHKRD